MIDRQWVSLMFELRPTPRCFGASTPVLKRQFSISNAATIANLTYRVTALFTGRDAASGLKHFGTRLAPCTSYVNQPQTDNVWAVDCSSFFVPSVSGTAIHGAYFETPGTFRLMREILPGLDRAVLEKLNFTKGKARPA